MGFKIMVCALLFLDLLGKLFSHFNFPITISTNTLVFTSIGIGYIAVGLYFAKFDGGLLDANTED